MSSAVADEERGLGKKRESLGRPKVFESKKEKKRRLILSDSESEEDAVTPCKRAAPIAEQNGNGSVVEKTSGLEGARCKDELKDKVMRPDIVKRKEEVGIDNKIVKELRSGKEELKFYTKKASSSDVNKKKVEVGTNEKKVGQLGTQKALNIDKTRALRPDIIKQREEAGTTKKSVTQLGSDKKELKFDKNKAMSSDVKRREEAARSHKDLNFDKSFIIKQKGGAVTNKKKATELGSDKEDLKFDKNKAMKSEVVRRREEAVTDRRKVTVLGSDSNSDRKRSRETPDAEITSKKIKFESSKLGRDQTKEIDGKKMKASSFKHTDKRTENKVESMGSKPVILAGRRRESPIEKISQAKLDKTGKLEAEELRRMERSGQRPVQKLKDNNTRSVGLKREESDISQQKEVRVQGKGGNLTVLPSNKKVGGLEKVHIRKIGEEPTKTSTSSTTAHHKKAKHPSLSGGKKVPDKPISILALGKRRMNTRTISSAEKRKSHEVKTEVQNKISLAEKSRSHEVKTEIKSSSRKTETEIVGPSSGKPDAVVKGDIETSSKTLLSTKQNTEEASEGRATVRRKIREQIKDILFSAGWKIDLRPRRGRNYEDQVYIPPTGGAGYWSITKAYAVFQNQVNRARNDNNKNSSKMSTGSDHNIDETSSSFSAIPTEVLNMLKRKVVNKRRKRIEDDEIQGSRRKKAKKTTKMKFPKNKISKANTGGVRGRKKLNGLVSSNTKGIVGSKSQNLHRISGKSNKSQRGCALLVRDANQEADTEYDDYVPYIWKRTVLSWMIDLGIVPYHGKVQYMNKKQTRPMQEGRITRDGIHCGCCSKIVTVSKFEIHAGSKLQQPYENIFVQEPRISLLQCQLNAWEKQESERQGSYTIDIKGDDPNDDTCGICGDGGDLICCDGCPSTFHQSCLGIEELPPGDWHCAYCTCRYCGVSFEDSTQGSGVPVSPLLSCSQCEEKYHQECIPEADAISTNSNNSHASFCGRSCRKVFRQLQKLLGVKNDLEARFSWRLIRRLHEDLPMFPCALPQRAECNAKIAVALAVMDECFLPIIDQRSGTNLIHNVVYNCGSKINRLNYNGFYTFILERDDEIISAASVRIHGTRLAEMPFIGTRNMYRRQGMCRRLLNGIESALCSLGIKKLIIPAISELAETWTTVFGFKPLEISQKQEVESINMLVFPSTGLLQKSLLRKDLAEQPIDINKADKVEPGIKHHNMLEVVAESSAISSVPHNHASDEAIAHSKHEVKDIEPNFPALGGYVLPTSDVAPESLNAQDQEHKSLENADNGLLTHPEAVYNDETVEGDKFQACSLTVPKIKIPCKGTVHDHHDIEIEDNGVVSNTHAVNDTSVQLTSEAKCTSPTARASTLQDSGAKTEPNLPCVDGTLLPHSSEAHCTSPGVTASTLPDTVANNLHIPVSSLESSSDATHQCRSDVRSTFSTALPAEHTIQASRECIVDGNQDIKDQITTLQPKLNALGENSGHCNSEVITRSMDLVTNKSLTASTALAVDEATVHAIHDVKADAVKSDVNDEFAESFVTGIVSRPSIVSIGNECQAAKGTGLTHVPDVIRLVTRPDCAVSEHGLQVSDSEKLTQRDSELVQESPEFPGVALPFPVEKLQDNKHDSADVSHFSSLPEPNDSSNECVLKRSQETNIDFVSDKNSCGLGENSGQHHAPDMACGSINVGCESTILSSSGVKSCEISGVSTSTGATYSWTPNAGNCNLDVAKDSALFVVDGSDLCAFVDTHNEIFGNAASAPDQCAIAESTIHHAAEDVCNLDCNNAVPGGSLNKFPSSTTVVVQHDLTVEDEATADVPVEPNHVSSVGGSDTGFSNDELAVVKRAHASGTTSHCASVVTKSLENGSESSNGSADASIL